MTVILKRLILLSCVILAVGGCTPAGYSSNNQLKSEVRQLKADFNEYLAKSSAKPAVKPRLLQGEIQIMQGNFDEYVTAAATKKEKDPGDVLIQQPAYGRLSSTYGHRKLSFDRRARLHAGIDLAAPKGTAVMAAGAGVVSFVGWKGAYGRTVEIDHGEGLTTRYAHMDKYIVKSGQQVFAGTPIGAVGNTGRSTGPHLHFEMRIDNKPIDPLLFVKWA
jgi:murein DD-endopeptidase MepM/ murein hydrolase activator NlpD